MGISLQTLVSWKWKPEFYDLIDKNQIKFEPPNFHQIFKQQLQEPLTFFQIFSAFLWFFDDSVMQPLMILCIVFFSNISIIIDRIAVIVSLRQMRIKREKIQRMEGGEWCDCFSDELRPGDIIKIRAMHEVEIAEPAQLSDLEIVKRSIPFGNLIPKSYLFKVEQASSHQYTQQAHSDILIVKGNCLVDESMLTGESQAILKEEILEGDGSNLQMQGCHKHHVLFSGTTVISQNEAVGIVLQTGFDTFKGKLARQVLINSETLPVDRDSYILLFILLVVALISSSYSLYQGLQDETRDRHKLFIRCILIITTVVPQEIPMIMNIALNLAISTLRQQKIYCSEPQKIASAGKTKVIAWDKTGTLTTDQTSLKGVLVSQLDESIEDLNCRIILAGCQTILLHNGEFLGDPAETAFFKKFNCELNDKTISFEYEGEQHSLKILKVYRFTSELKRMSVLVEHRSGGRARKLILTKGAPEILFPMLNKVGIDYK